MLLSLTRALLILLEDDIAFEVASTTTEYTPLSNHPQRRGGRENLAHSGSVQEDCRRKKGKGGARGKLHGIEILPT